MSTYTLYHVSDFQNAYTVDMPSGTGTGTGNITLLQSMSSFPTSFPVILSIWDTDPTFASTIEFAECDSANVGLKTAHLSVRGVSPTSTRNHAHESKVAINLVSIMWENLIAEVATIGTALATLTTTVSSLSSTVSTLSTTVAGKPDLATAGSAGTTPANNGTATTAARNDHVHKVTHLISFPTSNSPSTGDNADWVPNKWGTTIDIVDAYAVTKVAASSSTTINIYYATQAQIDGSLTWTSIFSTPVTINSGHRSSNTATAPVLSKTTLLAGEHLKMEITTLGTGLGKTAVYLRVKAPNTN